MLQVDLAGLAPGVGIVADLTNAGISVARGDYVGASLSMAAAIPIVGNIAGAGKIAHRLNKITKGGRAVCRCPRVVPNITKCWSI